MVNQVLVKSSFSLYKVVRLLSGSSLGLKLEKGNLLATPTLLDPRIKKLAFRDSGVIHQGEQWIVQEMAGLVPADS